MMISGKLDLLTFDCTAQQLQISGSALDPDRDPDRERTIDQLTHGTSTKHTLDDTPLLFEFDSKIRKFLRTPLYLVVVVHRPLFSFAFSLSLVCPSPGTRGHEFSPLRFPSHSVPLIARFQVSQYSASSGYRWVQISTVRTRCELKTDSAEFPSSHLSQRPSVAS